jgi:tRNA (cytidine/uridine-2'-O-)-methyltransferase
MATNTPHPAAHLVLVTPEIPANTGNIARLCAGAAVPLHLVEPLGFTLDCRIARRAGMDYWQHCEHHRHLTFEALEEAHPQGRFWFFSARATRSLYEAPFAPGDFLVLGPESTGLSSEFLDKGRRREQTLVIPMPGKGRSLNLSTAAGIALYEALRRQGRFDAQGGD